MKAPSLALLAGCLVLAGCAVTMVQTVAPGSYAVTAHGNVFQSREDLQAAIDRKAVKLCGSAGWGRVQHNL